MLNLQEFSPCLLVAMPQLLDPNFSRAVILLAEFKPEGAFGIVINRPLELTLGAVQSPNVQIAERYHAARLWYGGPVNQQQALLLATLKPGAEVVKKGAAKTGLRETAEAVGETVVMPLGGGVVLANPRAMVVGYESQAIDDFFKVLVGYAGWASQQLDQELAAGSWLVVPLKKDIVFSEPETMWEHAIRSIGVNPAALQVPPTSARH